MKTDTRSEYVTRDSILKLLTDAEVAKVCTAETASRLADGEEYLDLTKLESGVRQAPSLPPPMGDVLPRSAVNADTWNQIVSQLAVHAPRVAELAK